MTRVLYAPGKAMILGEYVVLDGAPAIVAAVDRHAKCTVTPHINDDDPSLILRSSLTDQVWTLRSTHGVLIPPNDPAFQLISVVQQHLQRAHIPLPARGATLTFDSRALSSDAKLGLGSSASIAALAAVALSEKSTWTSKNTDALFHLTHAAHQEFQGGVGSGSDVAAACFGGVLRMQKGCDPRPVPLPQLYPVVLYTGNAANTADFVRNVHAQRHKPSVQQALKEMESAATRGVLALEHAAYDEFLSAVRTFHRAEVKLTQASGVPVVTDDIAKIVDFMETCGGAAKASGAGGGDIVIAFFADAHGQQRAIKNATRHALHVVPLNIEPRGVASDVMPVLSP